jgi:hypothetical protein
MKKKNYCMDLRCVLVKSNMCTSCKAADAEMTVLKISGVMDSVSIRILCFNMSKVKVKISLLQAVEAHRVARG